MKKVTLFLFSLISLSSTAQVDDNVYIDTVYNETMNISFKNGTTVPVNINEIDSIFFKQFDVKTYYNKTALTPEIYDKDFTEEGVKYAIDSLKKDKILSLSLAGQFCMRGGKEGGTPGAHAYQRQYSLGPDLYAQYFTVPHKDFMCGSLTSTYDVSAEFNGGALGAYTMAKNQFMPVLNHPMIDSIPELKAIYLLYYSIIAQENADLSGPFTYLEDKKNSQSPEEYNDVETIYRGIVRNLDTIVACLNNYDTREQWYKSLVEKLIKQYCPTNFSSKKGDYTPKTFVKLANSLKLRMAIHISKVAPLDAKKWAEEAVAGGVIESVDEQHGLFPSINSFTHPLPEIANAWNDLRLSASFESLLMSLDHPYSKYVFMKNGYDIPHKNGEDILPANTRLCGIRSGVLVGNSQSVAENKRQAYSTINTEVFATKKSPLYFIKWAEVDFLRAEGALRGWNMGGTAQDFYERGIDNAYLEEPGSESSYRGYLADYKKIDAPREYVNVDPIGDGPEWPSVTKIGVTWNSEPNDTEAQLEKIITQKYLALFPLSTEAWTELRRTGYPKLFPVLNVNDGDGSLRQGEMIRRIPWVPVDPVAEAMVQNSGIPALGNKPDEQATRLWWDVDKPNI